MGKFAPWPVAWTATGVSVAVAQRSAVTMSSVPVAPMTTSGVWCGDQVEAGDLLGVAVVLGSRTGPWMSERAKRSGVWWVVVIASSLGACGRHGGGTAADLRGAAVGVLVPPAWTRGARVARGGDACARRPGRADAASAKVVPGRA